MTISEACDNGNVTGCLNCLIDHGFTCSGTNPSVCTSTCGDG